MPWFYMSPNANVYLHSSIVLMTAHRLSVVPAVFIAVTLNSYFVNGSKSSTVKFVAGGSTGSSRGDRVGLGLYHPAG